MKSTRCLSDIARRTLEGRPTAEVLNQYNPGNARVGRRPFGVFEASDIETYRLRFRQKLPNDDLNPSIARNWRRYETSAKENRNNPDSFHYEQYRHGGKAFQQVYQEDVERLTRFPEDSSLVIDVRSDFSNIKNHIPFSVRIPMEEVAYALQLQDTAFKSMYGFGKPEVGLDIICVSHDGVSSEKALKEFERWGYNPETLYNFRGGTNALFNETFSDFGDLKEEVDVADSKTQAFPLARPDYNSQVGPFSAKYTPYPPESLEELVRRDNDGSWKVDKPADIYAPTGKYAKTTRDYQQVIDSQWLRARMVVWQCCFFFSLHFYNKQADVKWYDNSHREPFMRWREPDLSHDRAYRPSQFQYHQFWRNAPV